MGWNAGGFGRMSLPTTEAVREWRAASSGPQVRH
jgi:hypothetical protein